MWVHRWVYAVFLQTIDNNDDHIGALYQLYLKTFYIVF
mgnify:CR=1 FL=1